MKNSPLSALVLIGVAGLVGTVGWFALLDDPIDAEPAEVAAPTAKTPTVMNVTPRERKLQQRLDDARAQIERYKEIGEVLPNGAIKTVDRNGTELFVHPELIEGVGRYGEPLFMMATYKKKEAVPLLRNLKAPKSENMGKMRKLPPGETVLSLGNKKGRKAKRTDQPSAGEGGSDAGSGEGGGGGQKSGGGAGQPGDLKDG